MRLYKGLRLLPLACLLALVLVVARGVKVPVVARLYPVVVNFAFLVCFAKSLRGESIIFGFATKLDKSILRSPQRISVAHYCRRVCLVWCAFFILNATLSLLTIKTHWLVYNGLVSYILMGALFIVEYIVRKKVMSDNEKLLSPCPLSSFNSRSRTKEHIVCFSGSWEKAIKCGDYKTWDNFLEDTAKIRAHLYSCDSRGQVDKWILHIEDRYLFLCAFTALLQCKKAILLVSSTASDYLKKVRSLATTLGGDGGVALLCDWESSGGKTFDVRAIVAASSSVGQERSIDIEAPRIEADSTRIFMFTSGSTGEPKVVRQRLVEFEADNAFVAKKWGDEFSSRKLVSTVSAHHIYGLLFSILLPFTLGVPFCRRRIEYPEELGSFLDVSYMIIAVPAFLRRVSEKYPLISPYIFTSGGMLEPPVAKSTFERVGAWPIEIYGSTETSGIAFRCSKDTLLWSVFDNATIWVNESGCLVIKSPYIKDPNGFTTSDAVQIKEDGRFALLGRVDNVVKIEEKRISLVEVEARLKQTPFVKDAAVIPMQSDKRQYLAAIVVLSSEGEALLERGKVGVDRQLRQLLLEYFEGVVIPKRFRYVKVIPTNTEGKRVRSELCALFSPTTSEG